MSRGSRRSFILRTIRQRVAAPTPRGKTGRGWRCAWAARHFESREDPGGDERKTSRLNMAAAVVEPQVEANEVDEPWRSSEFRQRVIAQM